MAHRNIRLPDDLDKKMKDAADEGSVSYNEVVRICCEMMVDAVHEDYKRRNAIFTAAKKAASERIRKA